MASRKQVQAAKRNIKMARRAAKAKRTIANLLGLLGVSAPEAMERSDAT